MHTVIRWIAPMLLSTLAVTGCAAAQHRDWDNNPPGPAGGPGTNWENPPGWRGGPGASPNQRFYRRDGVRYEFKLVSGGYYYSPRWGYWHPRYGLWNQGRRCWMDIDNNPPGPAGGRGTNWENPPGWRGGPGASPDRFDRCR
ncbi:hypothetical protein D7U93_11515 [Stenotrophomonas maltophilia]|uniref:hypothetical protein n=1 Tax=Stenotrophomonas TaxID=40323 RepID=UPI0007B2EE13|nr:MULTISPECIES: hypothetical protein [Stenotrophomonas]EME3308206.1 hypothetical protein [Pseudomonas aeruginosa]EKU9958493.1 hypothetical protein [Stenotrophomonas maltophilia]EKU9984512.1 hypothetical protein [Stenotrophomonas maltophilia]KZE61368.1 hypothetical protein AVW14_20855 [Stenotrophomonas maltophilia]MBA0379954.1 hypothetical protein [Stenotrophomonas maltophilia]